MKFKELAYKSTGPVLQVGGAAYMVYGFATGDVEAIGEGFVALVGGQLVSQRTKYITETFDKMNTIISGLEQKLGE